ncbi:glycosyltransferase family 2 protein [Lonsdalea quercina]
MINGKTIGVGIITHNRPDELIKLYRSLPLDILDELVIVNDGRLFSEFHEITHTLINNPENLGVGKSKNIALRYLHERNVDHFFLIEDDVFIKNKSVFERYIQASKISGIQHFMFSQATPACLDDVVKAKMNADYAGGRIQLYQTCDGAFVYYSKACIDRVGYMDETYYNALEHVDHTLAIINAGMHPPFWYFADIDNSKEFIGFDHKDFEHSTIFSQENYTKNQKAALNYFRDKHGVRVKDVPDLGPTETLKILKDIKRRHAKPVLFQTKTRQTRR